MKPGHISQLFKIKVYIFNEKKEEFKITSTESNMWYHLNKH